MPRVFLFYPFDKGGGGGGKGEIAARGSIACDGDRSQGKGTFRPLLLQFLEQGGEKKGRGESSS